MPATKFILLKKIYLFTFLMSLSLASIVAQSVNYADIVTAEEARPKNFEAYLVQLAWMNTPENRAVETEKTIADIEKKAVKWNWVEDIGASMNVNPTSNITVINGTEFFLPGITYGVSVNAGGLLTSGFERKIVAEKVKIAEAEVNQQKLKIRAMVSTAYQKYLLANEILKSRYEAEEDLSAAYTITKELFKKNRVEVTEYTNASSAYFSALEQRQVAEADIEMAIIDIEELIGVEWEAAQRFESVYGK